MAGIKDFLNKLIGDIDEMRMEGKVTVGGKSLLTHLVSTYWGVRGIPEQLADVVLPVFLFKVLGTPSDRGNQLSSLVFTPWAMKPLFALVSDIQPIAGFKKRWWMVTVSCMAIFACFRLFSSSVEELGGKQANTAFVYFFMMHTAIAMCDSLSQGKYTEICKAKGSAVVSFVSASKVLSGLLAVGFGAVLNDSNPRIIFLVILPFFVQAALVQGSNFMGDPKLENVCSPDMTVVKKDYKIVLTGTVLGLMALSVSFINDNISQLIFANVAVVVVLSMTFWSLPVSVAKINVYILFCRMAFLDFRYALLQWYTSDDELCPGNFPHFTMTVYQAVGLWMGNLATLFGVFLFERYVSHWNARRAFWVTTVFTMIAALFDLAMLTGFNRTLMAPLGFGNIKFEGVGRLDDLLGFLLGTQALKPIAVTLDDMPATVLLSKLCPTGVETTVFAILAALQNLGFQIAGLWASMYLGQVGYNIERVTFPEDSGIPDKLICNTGDASKFFGPAGMDGITWGVIIGNIILPLLTIPATFILLPNRNLDDDLTQDPDQDAVEMGAPVAAPLATGASVRSIGGIGGADLRSHPSFILDDSVVAGQKALEKGSFVSLTRGALGGGGSRFL